MAENMTPAIRRHDGVARLRAAIEADDDPGTAGAKVVRDESFAFIPEVRSNDDACPHLRFLGRNSSPRFANASQIASPA